MSAAASLSLAAGQEVRERRNVRGFARKDKKGEPAPCRLNESTGAGSLLAASRFEGAEPATWGARREDTLRAPGGERTSI